jgi:hypothetical protein
VEKQHIAEVLAKVGHNRQRAAQLLGIAASTLFEKIKRYNLDSVRSKNGRKAPPATPPGSGSPPPSAPPAP